MEKLMERVLILGCCGAGKSTFAKQLQTATGLTLIHLDQEYWQPNWTEPDAETWRNKVQTLADRPRWIIDGTYGGTLDSRLAKADTVIYLDVPTWKCLWRVVGRVWKYNGKQRPDMPEGCHERWDWAFMHYVAAFNIVKRPKILGKLEAVSIAKTVLIFKKEEEVTDYLAGFARK
jgi:adenylate kinase family enzyme